ncbi:alkaline phosphatase D family protein [Sphingobium lignivorans]|uniref:Alkaline phosphatase D n=1 Tax=Sphingobium lignivorans TaxID=2735886 RepID=A0ABR6NES8_9SPHN|nr:alkaline phosphatase D family protein [Sphingobium lignivorans]MBB5985785.1 alkaline phosphatase D [Sphingobium lignivorans]
MLTRRDFLSTGGAAAALGIAGAPAIVRAQNWFSDTPFRLGVASGDPAPDGFVIWTKLAPEPFAPHGGMPMSALPVLWEVASDDRFATIVASGTATARPELGHSVHVEVTGLEPDRPYWYRFRLGSDRSLFGRARTLPRAGAPVSSLRFGVCGCQHYEAGLYTAYRHLAQEDLAFVFHYGDFIYEYRSDYAFQQGLPVPKVRDHRLRVLYSLDDYRAHYAQYLLDIDLQAARSRHAFLSTFDDHEVENNWVQDFQQHGDVPPEIFALRRQAAMQAWYEHMPVRAAMIPRGSFIHANRALQYGNLASINLLDTRSFRSDQPCGDGFRPFCPDVADPKATVLGQAQESWLDANLARKDAVWTCLAQQVMMMPLDRRRSEEETEKILNLDSWAAYDAPRNRLMRRLAGVDNAVVLTGDEHQNFAGLLYDRDRPVAVECVTTSISSGGDGQDKRTGTDMMMANNPQLRFMNDQRGYSICEVTPEAWRTHFMVLDRVTTPGGTLSRRATATVPRRTVALDIG